MKIRLISIVCFLCLSMTVVFAEDQVVQVNAVQETGANEEVVETTAGVEDLALDVDPSQEEQIDPELLDRLNEYKLKFSGTTEVSSEIQKSINKALSSSAMPIDIVINGQYLNTDVDALSINSRTYVPLRAVIGAFNFTDVNWNEDAYKAIVQVGDKEIQFLINTNKLIVNDEPMVMDTPSLIINGRTMVPLRFICELLGFEVEWDSVYYTVTLKQDNFELNEDFLTPRFYSVEEMETFAKLVMKEAGSVSYETKHGVASVVMNQVKATYLENTIEGVIYDKSRLPHFPPAYAPGFHETVPNTESVLAVKKALRGENSVGSCIFFNTSPFKGRTIYKEVDGVYFCY